MPLGGGGDPCVFCGKRCYPAEAVKTTQNNIYHKDCFRCNQCQCKLTLAGYREDAVTKRLYCSAHYQQLAKAAGLDAVAKGGVDASKGVLVEEKKKEEELEEAERVGEKSQVWVSVDELAEAQRKVALGGPAPNEASEPYVRGKVVGRKDGSWGFAVEVGGRTLHAPKTAVTLADTSGRSVPDNLQLPQLTEPNLLDNLRTRFADGRIYTWTGFHELLAVNPYQPLPTLYALDGAFHSGPTPDDARPHAFSVGERLYAGAVRGVAQAVVVSGESGAGKTETNKHLLTYLRWRSGGGSAAEQRSVDKVAQGIAVANNVLETLGNAQTVHNNNSSRFGKYLEVFLGGTGGPRL